VVAALRLRVPGRVTKSDPRLLAGTAEAIQLPDTIVTSAQISLSLPTADVARTRRKRRLVLWRTVVRASINPALALERWAADAQSPARQVTGGHGQAHDLTYLGAIQRASKPGGDLRLLEACS